ncbi:hypothetical protein PTSG_11979 [Salpingoeca rosetta]|uniref:RWD domain-containing protein n=1 Tax=Salpingoeca rosetta (strain ATCC 50818 / BSB-021) TaxID=946362 RepID=F2U4L0_SALR5|nr:uncharacterized protein PTSG_11979 [Salpingoeca rosetta]EGD82576.1 hypothetical protein PTSG_11979 [Salpingoeca rosetta]|eukprot:XP_004995812.1 hypothetical protein PTSG_11979 [Salpingoeca rosetta]
MTIQDNIAEQLEECESLLCIFEDEGSLTVDADAVSRLSDWRRALETATAHTTGAGDGGDNAQRHSSKGQQQHPPATLTFVAKVNTEHAGSVELNITLPPEYPAEAGPQLLVRCPSHSRAVSDALQQRLLTLAADEFAGDCCLFQLIDAVPQLVEEVVEEVSAADGRSNGDNSNVDQDTSQRGSSNTGKHDGFMRQFIYFHHIYNKSKRRDILAHAHELDLSGFSVVGKPGLVCIEGVEANVIDYTHRLRRLPWQKMQVKVTQTVATSDVESERKFPRMHELIVDAHGQRGNHADMGQVRQYLEEHGLGDVFTHIFAVGS